jgi:hypothetical protein
MQNKRKRRKEIKLKKRLEPHKLKKKESELVHTITYVRSVFNINYGVPEVNGYLQELEQTHKRMQQLKIRLSPVADQLIKDFIVKQITES